MRLRRSAVVPALTLFFDLAAAVDARADGFAVNRFEPSERGSEWFTGESLDFRGHFRPAAGLVFDYANRPLTIFAPDGSVRTAVVADQLFAHAGASAVFWDR